MSDCETTLNHPVIDVTNVWQKGPDNYNPVGKITVNYILQGKNIILGSVLEHPRIDELKCDIPKSANQVCIC